MTKMRTAQLLGIGLIAIVLLFSFPWSINQEINQPAENNTIENEEIKVLLSIEDLYIGKQLTTYVDETVLSVLQKENEENPDLQLLTKEYSGLGTLVQGMNGKNNGDNNKYWQYTINGTTPLIGSDKYILSDGDDIKWHFNPSEF